MKKIYGIGVGPGAEELLTLQAVRILKRVDKIFVPETKGQNRALDTIKDLIDMDKVMYLKFPMGKMSDEDYKDNASIMENALDQGQEGAFITIGDVMFYSTVINSMNYFTNGVQVEFIPGIPSFVAAASRTSVPLAFTGESFLVTDHLPEHIDESIGTIAILKSYRIFEEDLDRLEEEGFEYHYIQRVSYEEEKILTKKEDIVQEEDYISLILARRRT